MLKQTKGYRLHKIISGGQTGVDRAALDVAIRLNIPHGGWCPKGRLAQDGIISSHYDLTQTPSTEYAQRTEWNVRDSDGTLIVIQDDDNLTGGTKLTLEEAIRYHKPYFIFNVNKQNAISLALNWMQDNKIHTLNVAGPRGSKANSIYNRAVKSLTILFNKARGIVHSL